MADTTHKGFNAIQTALTLTTANATDSAGSSTIDNSTALELYANVELVVTTQAAARSAGAKVSLYILHSLDGSNFDDALSSTADLVGAWALDATATARRRTLSDIPIPPGLFQFMVRNDTGQAFAASTTVKYRTHSIKTL